ncbi:hypothetical protein OX283_014405 [Flavobacterium sp. SUN052]|uniref:hypothetical protein n=1 Tax=Flavobacterium sp. SUN052 TaxID=3002441 RepID=UPI00237ED4E1|nr:hypothetical protein [Flavobacterium sp. SUN052]MEC4005859.1 hypothetical protein [Flavobacterium sp. SUN052]
MSKENSNVTEKENPKSFWNNSLVIFFLAPIVFLFIAKFAGNRIFYGKAGNSRTDLRRVLLLSCGSLFYLILLIIVLC